MAWLLRLPRQRAGRGPGRGSSSTRTRKERTSSDGRTFFERTFGRGFAGADPGDDEPNVPHLIPQVPSAGHGAPALMQPCQGVRAPRGAEFVLPPKQHQDQDVTPETSKSLQIAYPLRDRPVRHSPPAWHSRSIRAILTMPPMALRRHRFQCRA